jgi:hypothetical protein
VKLLIEIEAHGIEHLHIQEPAVPLEIGAFIRALVKSRTRGPEPKVSVVVLGEHDVAVDARAHLHLQGELSDAKKAFGL